MKTINKKISPLSSEAFQKMVHRDQFPTDLPNVSEYFSNLLEHFSRYAIGSYCWFVADRLKGTTHNAGGHTDEIMGLKAELLINQGPEIIFSRAHPEDLPKIFAYSEYWAIFLSKIEPKSKSNYVNCIFIRLMNNRENYAWVMIQYLDSFLDDEGNALYIFTAITDVSHIKHTGEALMTIRDIKNNSSTCIRCYEQGQLHESSSSNRSITPREQEVLRHIATGLGSKQMAEKMGVSIHTINNHRQNLLRKSGAKSAAELVSYGVMMGHLAW